MSIHFHLDPQHLSLLVFDESLSSLAHTLSDASPPSSPPDNDHAFALLSLPPSSRDQPTCDFPKFTTSPSDMIASTSRIVNQSYDHMESESIIQTNRAL